MGECIDLQKIISGTDKQFYDMIIEFHDDIFKNKVHDFAFNITVEPDCDMSLFQDFVSLITDIREDWDDEIKVAFNIITLEGQK